jgi:hypothetical protein
MASACGLHGVSWHLTVSYGRAREGPRGTTRAERRGESCWGDRPETPQKEEKLQPLRCSRCQDFTPPYTTPLRVESFVGCWRCWRCGGFPARMRAISATTSSPRAMGAGKSSSSMILCAIDNLLVTVDPAWADRKNKSPFHPAPLAARLRRRRPLAHTSARATQRAAAARPSGPQQERGAARRLLGLDMRLRIGEGSASGAPWGAGLGEGDLGRRRTARCLSARFATALKVEGDEVVAWPQP